MSAVIARLSELKAFKAMGRTRQGLHAPVEGSNPDWAERIDANLNAIEELIRVAREEMDKYVSNAPDAEGCTVLGLLLTIEALAVGAVEIYEDDES